MFVDMQLSEHKRRVTIRVCASAGAALFAIALAGCAPAMAPVQLPSSRAQLKLCNVAPAFPPNNLASNPNYREFSVDAIDPTGAPIGNLTQSDFVATEDGRSIPITYFHMEQGRPPVSVGILVDKSASMVTKLPMVSASVDALLSKLDRCDEVFLFAFGIDPILVEDFTTDHLLVSERLKFVGAGGQTPFYDGVQQGIMRLDTSHYPDRVLIIYTDDLTSLDNASKRASRADIVSAAVNSRGRFFVIGVGKPDATNFPVALSVGPWTLGAAPNGVNADGLKGLATDLGGQFFLIAGEPDDTAQKVAVRQRNSSVYSASPPRYSPLSADPGRVEQLASSVAAQIDRHYTIGITQSGKPAASAGQIIINMANRPSVRTVVRPIALKRPTP